MLVTEEDIDNHRLIEEVEVRPLLYNKNLKEYSDNIAKSRAWEEVCQQLLQVWDQLSAKEKTDAGKLVQKRWKNIRSCFARELRDQKQTKSGQAAKKDRRKYKYFDNLLFLVPSMETRETSGNILDATNRDDESDNDVSEEENSRKKPKKEKSIAEKPKPFEEKLLSILTEKKQANTPTPTDKETHFALSLVPLLKSLPEDSQLDIQIEILQIIKRAQQRNRESQTSENCPPCTSGVKYRIIQQKNKVSDARYTIIQPRRSLTPQLTHRNIVASSLSLPATSSPMSLPATSPQMSLPATSPQMSLPAIRSPMSLPATSSPMSLPATSPQNEDNTDLYSSPLPHPTTIAQQRNRESQTSVNCPPSTSGVKYRIIQQKPKVSDARYTIIQPRRSLTPQLIHKNIVASSLSLPATSSQMSLPATSPQMSLPATSSPMSLPASSPQMSLSATSSPMSLPATSPQNEDNTDLYSSPLSHPTPSPNSNENMTLQSYLSNYTDTDESEIYDVCYNNT